MVYSVKEFSDLQKTGNSCGKYKRVRYKGMVCDRCGVEVTKSKVRRERMGHIELAAPVSHIWYFKGIPSRMGLLLDMSPRALEEVIYFASYVVVDPGPTGLEKKTLLSEAEFRDYYDKYPGQFVAKMGAEGIKIYLKRLILTKNLNCYVMSWNQLLVKDLLVQLNV